MRRDTQKNTKTPHLSPPPPSPRSDGGWGCPARSGPVGAEGGQEVLRQADGGGRPPRPVRRPVHRVPVSAGPGKVSACRCATRQGQIVAAVRGGGVARTNLGFKTPVNTP